MTLDDLVKDTKKPIEKPKKKSAKFSIKPNLEIKLERKGHQELNEQEWIFVQEYIRTKNPFVAYQVSTGDKYNPWNSFTLLNKPHIQKAIANIAKHFESQVLQNLNEWINDVELLAQECREKGELANVIKCKQMTGTALGFLKQINNTQVNVINANFTPDIALENLRKSLQIENNDATLTQNNANSTLQGNS